MIKDEVLRLYSRLPFERYLRFLILDNRPYDRITEILEQVSGFKVPNDSFYDDFKNRIIESSEVVKDFFKKKPDRNTIAFKSCLVFLEIEDLYNTAKLDDKEYLESWLFKTLSFCINFKKAALLANIYRARGKTIEEIREMLLKYYRYEFSTEELEKYFFYFFEVSWMTPADWQNFTKNQVDKRFQYLYQLIEEEKEGMVDWSFNKGKSDLFSEEVEKALKYGLPIITREIREYGRVSQEWMDFISCYFGGKDYDEE